MILDHIAQRAGAFVVAAPPFQPDGFGGRDLDVFDVTPVPDWLEQRVGETERQNILHGFFAEVMVDAVNLRFGKQPAEQGVEFLRRFEVVPERLLDHDSDVRFVATER